MRADCWHSPLTHDAVQAPTAHGNQSTERKSPGRKLCDLAFTGAAWGSRTPDLRITGTEAILPLHAVLFREVSSSLIRARIAYQAPVLRAALSTGVRPPLGHPLGAPSVLVAVYAQPVEPRQTAGGWA
jgi:hypothetical protein